MQQKPSLVRVVRDLVSPRSWGPGLALVASVLINACTEMLGVASIFPLMAVATRPQAVNHNLVLHWLYGALGRGSAHHFVMMLGGVFLGFFILNSVLNAWTYWLCLRFSLRASDSMATSLLSHYLQRPYVWFLSHHSVDLVRNVLDETDKLVERVIMRSARLLMRAVTALFICVGLLWINPLVAIATALALSALYSQIYRLFKRHLDHLGTERIELNSQRFRTVHQALGTVKEARAFPCTDHLRRRFQGCNERYSSLIATEKLVGELPRHLTETIAMAAITGVLLFLFASQGDAAQVVPIVGVYIMAIWRLVPALQQAYKDAVEIRFYLPLLYWLHGELTDAPDSGTSIASGERLPLRDSISLDGVSYTYPEAARTAVRGVRLRLRRGTSTALVGQTGCGKTTLADLVAGYLQPELGEVRVDGTVLSQDRVRAWQRNVGYVPQETFLIDETLRRNIAFGLPDDCIDETAVRRAAHLACLDELIAKLPRGFDTLLGERGVCLSGGERQRIGIARALYHDPELLILDESTSALDAVTEAAVMHAMGNLAGHKTLLVIAHRLSTVQFCDQVCVLDNGTPVASGPYPEVARSCPQLCAMVAAAAKGQISRDSQVC